MATIKEEIKMKSKIIIRKARKEDIDPVLEIGNNLEDALKASKNKKAHFHEKGEFILFIKNSNENIFLVAEANSRIVGFLYAKILSKDWCMIDNLAIKKEFQKHHIGTSLVNELSKILKKRKITYVQILEEVHHKNTRNFWKGRGFKEEKVFVWADKILK
jgi:N-acetylglutamate synthase-like GNAT family acetyltransferase